MQDDIAERKASGGAVARIKGGTKTNIATGVRRVDVGGKKILRVQYRKSGAWEQKDFPDTADGLRQARAFVYANLPLAVRRAQNATNLEVLPFAA